MAPEIVKKQDYDPKATDVWAVGILTYRMLYGIPPFRAPSEKELYNKICKGAYSFPSSDDPVDKNNSSQNQLPPVNPPTNISLQAKDFIKKMLCYQARERLPADQLLEH